MSAILRKMPSLEARPWVRGTVFAGTMATIGVTSCWGFTVDDALITARVAHHIALGIGYRFNAAGAVVDAVTPLGWAYVLAPFAQGSPLAALHAARWLGAIAFVASAAWLGGVLARRGTPIWPLSLFALSAPLGLWASAGMETAVVIALVTIATEPGLTSVFCLGLAAAWRPELLPYAAVLSLARAATLPRAARDFVLVLAPAVLAALARWIGFGSPHPLAIVAKPASSTQGFWYALEAFLWTGPMWLWLCSGWPWTRASVNGGERAEIERRPRRLDWTDRLPGCPVLERSEAALMIAIVAHFFAIGLAGGDWMPAYRLAAPVLPAALRVACHIAVQRRRFLTALGLLFALLASVRVGIKLVPSARHIVEQRERLILAGSRVLSGASIVASPDVGWVGAAFSGTILDLAGATDEAVAFLPGGHTSKRIELRLLESRRVDHLIVLLAAGTEPAKNWADSSFARAIDFRAAMLGLELGCQPRAVLELPYSVQSYLVLRCPSKW